MKKAISFILSVVLIVASTLAATQAAYASGNSREEALHISESEGVSVTLSSQNNRAYVKFSPESSGIYEFKMSSYSSVSDAENALFYGYISGAENEHFDGNMFVDPSHILNSDKADFVPAVNETAAGEMQAGNTYYLVLSLYNTESFSADISVKKGHICKYCDIYRTTAFFAADGGHYIYCPSCDYMEIVEEYCAPYKVELSQSSYVYDGKGHFPSVTVYDKRLNVIDPSHYTLSCEKDNKTCKSAVEIGDAYAVVKFNGEAYKGSVRVEFTIIPKTAEIKSVTAKSERLCVKWTPQKNASGYYVLYCENKEFRNAAVREIKVSGKDKSSYTVKNLKADKKYYVKVLTYKEANGHCFYSASSDTYSVRTKPAATKITSISAKSKGFTLKWKKQSGISGYQIKYSTSKSFKNAESVTVKGAKNTSKTVKNLKANKKYYVCVRTYKTVNGKKRYSDWSSTKSVNVKR